VADPYVPSLVSGVDVTTESRPFRIVRVIARMNIGGPAWQVSVLTRHLGKPSFDSTLVCGTVEPSEADFLELRDPDLEVTRLPSMRRSVRFLGDLWTLFALVRLMRRIKPDLVHTHTTKAGVLGRLAALLSGVPLRVHTFHGHVLSGYFSPTVTAAIVRLERLLARATSSLVAVGSQVRDDLLASGVGEAQQYVVIPPGVEDPKHLDNQQSRTSLGLPTDGLLVVYVGRLSEIKRVDRLVAAWRIVLQNLSKPSLDSPRPMLVIVGDGELRTQIEPLVTDLSDSVRFLGWQSNLSPVYAAADIAVLTSDNEGTPVSLIEASMEGVPCVTTDVGSVRDVVVHGVTGLVVATEPGAVADALSTLLSNEEMRRRFGEAAAAHATQSFSVAKLVQNHRDLYLRLLTKRTS